MSRQSYENILAYILADCEKNINSIAMEFINTLLSEYPYK